MKTKTKIAEKGDIYVINLPSKRKKKIDFKWKIKLLKNYNITWIL